MDKLNNVFSFPMKRSIEDDMAEKTPVSLLQELCIQESCTVPMYESIQHESDPKMFTFLVEAFGCYAKGSGRSKREAKHDASANLISEFFLSFNRQRRRKIRFLNKKN